jgi:hypothetical protein
MHQLIQTQHQLCHYDQRQDFVVSTCDRIQYPRLTHKITPKKEDCKGQRLGVSVMITNFQQAFFYDVMVEVGK